MSSYKGLWPAAKEGSDAALNLIATRAAVNLDIYWLEEAAALNSLHAQLALGRLTKGKEQQYWWGQSANNGHGPSQFALSSTAKSTQQRIGYLEKAALNQHKPAIIALSNYYYEINDATNALKWLEKASQYDHASIFKLAKMLWQQGQYEEATLAFLRASTNDNVAKAYFETIKSLPRQSINILSKSLVPLNEQCAQQLQFVATSLDSAVQAKIFKNHFELDKRFANLPICIKPIIWLGENELTCELVGQRKICDLTSLAERTFSPSYTHLVFFLNEGKGYVQNGVMYLDESDTYTVFVHELAHFVGFVDEYAVSALLASQYCDKGNAPNVIVSEHTEFNENATFKSWQKYYKQSIAHDNKTPNIEDSMLVNTPRPKPVLEIGGSSTCAAVGKQSYKPSKELTFMEYHDTAYIPPLYLMMWKDLLKQHHQSIAVSRAFELQMQQSENREAETHWTTF